MNRTCHSSFPGWADAVLVQVATSGLCSTWAAGWEKRPAIWHLEQAVLSLERHHGWCREHLRVWKVERHESAVQGGSSGPRFQGDQVISKTRELRRRS